MKSLIHSVLGTDYEVLIGCRDEINIAEENMGECRVYAKKILVCTDQGDCTEEELRVKVQEIVAHEFLHAYLNEAGVPGFSHTEDRNQVLTLQMVTKRRCVTSI